MRLEDLSAVVRPRAPWEAVDLGCALVRRHFLPLLTAWLLCVGPLVSLILLSSRWLPLSLVMFLLWWLKPIYDRVPLFYLSRTLFGETPRLIDTLRAWPGLMIKGLPLALIGARLSPNRSLFLPVVILEGLKGKARKTRQAVLARHSGGIASSLLMNCSVLESIFTLALLAITVNFLPADLVSELSEQVMAGGFMEGDFASLLQWTIIGCWLAALTLVELFYIGGGFGIYINSRTHLEGWDVEIAFRRMGTPLVKAAAILFFVFLPISAQSALIKRETKASEKSPATAPGAPTVALELQAPGETAAEHAISKQQIKEVLSHEDFKNHTKKVVSWKLKNKGNKGPKRNPGNWNLDFKGDLLRALGYVLFYAVIAFAVWKIGEFIYKNWHLLRRNPSTIRPPAPAPLRTMVGLDITPESLPDDIITAARKLWDAGDAHGAMSLLYRGSLSWFIHRAALPLKASDTEGDCLRLVKRLDEPARGNYFGDLTSVWVTVAYARRLPRAGEVEALLSAWPFAEERSPQ